MVEPGRKKGTLRFAIKPKAKIKQAEVAGDFNDWQPTVMRKQKDGSYVANVEATPGVLQYKFIVVGEWVADPDNSTWAPNQFGTMNSVVKHDT